MFNVSSPILLNYVDILCKITTIRPILIKFASHNYKTAYLVDIKGQILEEMRDVIIFIDIRRKGSGAGCF